MPDAPLSNAYRIPLNQLDVITARLYAENGYPHDAWRRLRAEDPVHWCEPPQYRPFWAVTKAAHITEVSKNPGLFRSA
ncbi:MAG: cytochrome P450, partial [Deltaproteobacteria bacterium]|nr:cytochrome P450 [Deltaproteobacteria bacterium]